MKKLFAGLLTVCCVSVGAKDLDPKRDGQAALAAGDYTKAYKTWFASAVLGRDPEIQESVALMLLSDKPIHARFNGERKVMGVRLLFRAALNGRVSAMQSMAAGTENGSFGLIKDAQSADCWRQAALAARSPGQQNACDSDSHASPDAPI